MSARARRRERAALEQPKAESRKPKAETAAPSRSEVRNDAARAKLVPLRDGERPTAVTVAAVVSAILVAANLGLGIAGYKIHGHHQPLSGVIVFSLLLGLMAWGLWRARYWAVLGMQALLALTMLIVGLSLPLANNLRAVLFSVGILLPAGALFWFLIKAMARIQMPERK